MSEMMEQATAEEPKPPAGASKKQQRIAEIVKEQLRAELHRELAAALDQRLSQLVPEAGQPPAQTPEPGEPQADALQAISALRDPGLQHDPQALRLLRQARGRGPQAELRALADLATLALARAVLPAGAASQAIPPGGGGAPPPDLRAEYERRLGGVRPGDLAAVMELKREFKRRGLEIY